jgi:hypothetical protein
MKTVKALTMHELIKKLHAHPEYKAKLIELRNLQKTIFECLEKYGCIDNRFLVRCDYLQIALNCNAAFAHRRRAEKIPFKYSASGNTLITEYVLSGKSFFTYDVQKLSEL